MADFATLLRDAAKQNHLILSPHIEKKLICYLELLQTWNRVFNLTTITDTREMVYLHLIDSLIISPYLHGKDMLDVGTGAGLPGIPLAILHPETHWTLLDKNSKKTRFLVQTIAELGLKNISVIHSRTEDFHPSINFDTILSRALGTIRMFVETTAHLLQPDGIFLAMKGKYPHDELADLPSEFIVQAVIPLQIKGMNVERHVIRIQRKI